MLTQILRHLRVSSRLVDMSALTVPKCRNAGRPAFFPAVPLAGLVGGDFRPEHLATWSLLVLGDSKVIIDAVSGLSVCNASGLKMLRN